MALLLQRSPGPASYACYIGIRLVVAFVASDVARIRINARKASEGLQRDLARADDCARRSSADATRARAEARKACGRLEEQVFVADADAVRLHKELKELKEKATQWETLGRRAVARLMVVDVGPA